MKNPLIGAFFLVLAAIPFLYEYGNQSDKLATKKGYLSEIQSLAQLELSGPDKASFRDLIMTMNPVTKRVPKILPLRGRVQQETRDLSWEQVPSREMAGRTRDLMIDPNDENRLWIGTATGGMWYNPDFRNNAQWVPIADDWESMSISSLTYDPVNPSTFYAGTGESFTSVPIYRESSSSGVGIYKSSNGGVTWQLLPATIEFDYINDLVVREENGVGVIYAAVASGTYQGRLFASEPSDGLYRSADGGATWTQVLPNVEGESYSYAVSDIELTESGELYVGTMRNLELKGGGHILRSTDGLEWIVYPSVANAIAAVPFPDTIIPGRVILKSGKNVVYAIGTGAVENAFGHYRDNPQFTHIYKQTGSGIWERIPDPFQLNSVLWSNIPWHALAMGVDPTNGEDLIIGALDMYAIQSPRPDAGILDWKKLTDWSVSYNVQGYLKQLNPPGTNVDSLYKRYVHGDVHIIHFIEGTDEVLMATDGGIYYSPNISARNASLEVREPLEFREINNGLNTMQFYTTALNPRQGNNEVLAGAQDNHTVTTEAGLISIEGGIGYGDGAYCFFDADDPQLRMTSAQANYYNVFLDRQIYFTPVPRGGTFINPADYDDRSNLLYTNIATDGGVQQLFESLKGRYLDSLIVFNVNKYLNKPDLGRDTITVIGLGTGTQAAFSALKISPWEPADQATMILGNQLGDVYRIRGLPNDPQAEKIDNNQLPAGYVSSVDVGATSDHILVTLSNYGIESVWFTGDGGENWTNLDRNLPDIPVRYGLFNPNDHTKVVIATERGIWGLENRLDPESEWVSYNEGFPNVRVDMIKTRASDSVIVAATHGRGIFLGKLDQGDMVLSSDPNNPLSKLQVYPNPFTQEIRFSAGSRVAQLRLLDFQGKQLGLYDVSDNRVELPGIDPGVYIGQLLDRQGELVVTKKLVKAH